MTAMVSRASAIGLLTRSGTTPGGAAVRGGACGAARAAGRVFSSTGSGGATSSVLRLSHSIGDTSIRICFCSQALPISASLPYALTVPS